MSELTGMSRTTILKGIKELKEGIPPGAAQRVRRPGGGRKRLEETDPGLDRALQKIMDETTAGDPMSLLRWTSKSTAAIAEELHRQGHAVSGETVRRRLLELEYSLRGNAKNKEHASEDGRDEQFRYINSKVKRFLRKGEPVLSVDTKKKERVGEFKNPGKTWRPKGNPREVNVYDYPHLGKGNAIPYGAYDVGRNEGFVSVGVTKDTAEFAVEAIRRWWRLVGRRQYPGATELMICADGGGSNGSRNRSWKFELQRLADQLSLAISVCHYPPGTSKWNKIEHRMFSFISLNWKGEPLVSYETVLNLISATKTRSGLKVKAKLDQREYERGVTISDEQMASINIKGHKARPELNYTIRPRESDTSRKPRGS